MGLSATPLVIWKWLAAWMVVGMAIGSDAGIVMAQEATKPAVPSLASDEPDYSTELPRIPPRSPSEAIQAFDVAPGFEIDLVAAEPLVFDRLRSRSTPWATLCR